MRPGPSTQGRRRDSTASTWDVCVTFFTSAGRTEYQIWRCCSVLVYWAWWPSCEKDTYAGLATCEGWTLVHPKGALVRWAGWGHTTNWLPSPTLQRRLQERPEAVQHRCRQLGKPSPGPCVLAINCEMWGSRGGIPEKWSHRRKTFQAKGTSEKSGSNILCLCQVPPGLPLASGTLQPLTQMQISQHSLELLHRLLKTEGCRR